MSKGTMTISSTATIITLTTASIAIPAVIAVTSSSNAITAAYSGCYHTHIYNWMVQPSLATTAILTSVTAGFGNLVVAYGYSMVGTSATSCVVSTIVTTTLFVKSATFAGAQY
jgi:hypothetical protein